MAPTLQELGLDQLPHRDASPLLKQYGRVLPRKSRLLHLQLLKWKNSSVVSLIASLDRKPSPLGKKSILEL